MSPTNESSDLFMKYKSKFNLPRNLEIETTYEYYLKRVIFC